VAVFDTAFHRTMPAHAAQYAIAHELTAKHAIYRYGFHGLAHGYMAEQYARLRGITLHDSKLITLQLGSGCSITAVKAGRSIDTSMGFTPLEGLVMGTRAGDIDPALVPFLARRESVSADEVERWLNTRSGLLGVSGRSGDVRDLLEAEAAGDSRAALALEMFCYRARKYIGAYMAAMGGADAIIFGGGIGEHAPDIRARISDGLQWAGLRIDETRNAATTGRDGEISTDDSEIAAYVIRVDEEQVIAQETARLLRGSSATRPA
jgi:acetate kinase